jgi:putative ABC transport system permease protein
MGGAVYIGALNLRASIRGSVDVLFTDLMRFQMAIRFARPYPGDSIEALARQVAGVAGAEAWSGARAGVGQADGTLGNTFAITALPPASRMVGYRVERGRWLKPGDRGALVVNRRLLEDQPGLSLGHEATLIIAGRPSRWTVVGVVESGPSPGAYATREALAGETGDPRARVLVIAAADRSPVSQSELVQRLRGELVRGGFEVESSQLLLASRAAMEDHLLMVAGFLMIMSQLMIVVGGLGLASTMSLAVLERTREIGVLRAIGARHPAILTMVQVEGLVISLASWLIAIPMSLPMSVILGRAFTRVMIPVEVTWVPDVSAVLLWLGVVLVVSLVACAWPAYRAMRITTAAALAYE